MLDCNSLVTIRQNKEMNYPENPPYSPSTRFPEYPFGAHLSDSQNHVYEMIRLLLHDLNLDEAGFGTAGWNPLGDYVGAGASVVLKPNWVWIPPSYRRDNDIDAILTHSSILRAMIDYSYIAVGSEGRITVLDSPIESTNWRAMLSCAGFISVMDFYQRFTDVPLEVIDIRDFRLIHPTPRIEICGIDAGISFKQELPGDPRGYVLYDLKKNSEYDSIPKEYLNRLRSPQRWTHKEVLKYHTYGKHIYSISRTLVESDLIINLPKLKHHKKEGVTLSLKNLVGVTNKKTSLPHYRTGFPPKGDEHPYPHKWHKKIREVVAELNLFGVIGLSFNYGVNSSTETGNLTEGEVRKQMRNISYSNWYGGDTIWRMILDLNKVVFCGDINGRVHREPQRKYLSIIDGLVGGDRRAPLNPRPRKSGIFLASENPVALDIIATYLMGFDPKMIKTLVHSNGLSEYGISPPHLANTQYMFNGTEKCLFGDLEQFLSGHKEYITHFEPSVGWFGHIESEIDTSIE